MKLLIKISYLGTRYCGYQAQPNGETVQQKLNEATRALFGFDCDIVGCSRTDSGVHAKEFCATVCKKGTEELQTTIPIERIPQAMNMYLPPDISVFEAEWVPGSFHARYSVVAKEYVYRIYNRREMDPFEVGRAAHLPVRLTEEDLQRMRQAADAFCGTHDFSAYMAQGSKITDPVRTIMLSLVKRDGDLILFRVRADGFLYNMVRILAGTLVEVGQGKIDPADIPSITESRDRSRAGLTMPACGLYLNRVFYKEPEE